MLSKSVFNVVVRPMIKVATMRALKRAHSPQSGGLYHDTLLEAAKRYDKELSDKLVKVEAATKELDDFLLSKVDVY